MAFLTGFLETYWWLIPLFFMVLCFLWSEDHESRQGKSVETRPSDSALGILDREIGPIEYEDRILTMGLKADGDLLVNGPYTH